MLKTLNIHCKDFSAVVLHQSQHDAKEFEKENSDPTKLYHTLSTTHQKVNPAVLTKKYMKGLKWKLKPPNHQRAATNYTKEECYNSLKELNRKVLSYIKERRLPLQILIHHPSKSETMLFLTNIKENP